MWHSTLALVGGGAYIIIKAASRPQLQLQLPWLRAAFWPTRDAFGKLQRTENGKSCHAPKWVKRATVAHVAYTQCARVYIIKKKTNNRPGKTKRNETANEIENENKNMGKSAAHKNVAQRVVQSI